MAQDAVSPVGQHARSWRRFRFPLAVIAIAVLSVVMPRIWEPAARMGLILIGVGVASVVALIVWFFGFSPFRGRTRLAVLGCFLLMGLASAAVVRDVEFTGSWRPILRYRWEARAADLLDQHRAQIPAAEDLPPTDLTVDPLRDFPRYRGRNCDGVVQRVKLATDWKSRPPRLLWRQPAGGGYAGFAVAGNVAVTIEQRRDQEVVVCYDRATGRERWVYSYPSLFHRSELMGGDGPRTTPTISDGYVYSLGANGHLLCLDGATGKPHWSVNILEDNGAKNAEWAMSGSPLIFEDLVIVNPGIDPQRNAGKGAGSL
jgi:outer membrane protein assembly factor BamB